MHLTMYSTGGTCILAEPEHEPDTANDYQESVVGDYLLLYIVNLVKYRILGKVGSGTGAYKVDFFSPFLIKYVQICVPKYQKNGSEPISSIKKSRNELGCLAPTSPSLKPLENGL